MIDEDTLVKLLEAGDVGGAGLDVYEHEPAVNPEAAAGHAGKDALPHMGSATIEGCQISEKVIINIRTFLDNHKPPDRVLPSMLWIVHRSNPMVRRRASAVSNQVAPAAASVHPRDARRRAPQDESQRRVLQDGRNEPTNYLFFRRSRLRHSAMKATNAASARWGWRRLR